MKNRVLMVVGLALLVALSGCDSLFGPSIPGPDAPSVQIASEATTVSWPSVDGATEYTLLYTDDGEAVTASSEVAYTGAATQFTHEDLDSRLTYRYALRVRTSEGESDVG